METNILCGAYPCINIELNNKDVFNIYCVLVLAVDLDHDQLIEDNTAPLLTYLCHYVMPPFQALRMAQS